MASKCSKVVLTEPSLEKLLAARNLTRDSLRIECPEGVCSEIALLVANWKLLAPFIKLNEVDEADIDADNKKNAEKKIGMRNHMDRLW